MSELSNSYRDRLARMSGETKSSSSSSSITSRRSSSTRQSSSSALSNFPHLAEYKQMRGEVQHMTVSTRSDAAALQNDLAQRYNLQNHVRPGQRQRKKKKRTVTSDQPHSGHTRRDDKASSGGYASSGHTSGHVSSSSSRMRPCDSCGTANPSQASVCESCGYFLAGSQQVPLTMAQSRGLVSVPVQKTEALKDFEWESIEKDLASRQDAYCPICMEGFNRGHEVLLSCSHMYHRSCLQSFEKFMKSAERSCPICRTTNYQKKMTHVGSRAFEVVCATVIQKNWRGHWCRSLYYDELKSFYRNGGVSSTSCKKKFYEKELSSHANRLTKEGETMENEVNSLFDSTDKVMQENRDLDAAFELMMMERHNFGGMTQFSTVVESIPSVITEQTDFAAQEKEEGEVTRAQWNDILKRALHRGDNVECSICMSDIEKNRNRRVVILSCSHMFHQQCIMMLEDFVKDSEDCPLCPMCRCPFERKLLSRDCDAFNDAVGSVRR